MLSCDASFVFGYETNDSASTAFRIFLLDTCASIAVRTRNDLLSSTPCDRASFALTAWWYASLRSPPILSPVHWYMSASSIATGIIVRPCSASGDSFPIATIGGGGAARVVCCPAPGVPDPYPQHCESTYFPSHPSPVPLVSAVCQMSIDAKCERFGFGYPTPCTIAHIPSS